MSEVTSGEIDAARRWAESVESLSPYTRIVSLCNALDARDATIIALREQIAGLREALEWYADEQHYDEQGVVIGRGEGPKYIGAGDPQEAWYEGDYGEKARAALAAVPAVPAPTEEKNTENATLREQISGLTAALQQAQAFALTVEYTDRFDNMYWAMADTLTKAIDAALAAAPVTDREADRQSRMAQWLREPWDDAPSAPTEKNTEVASLREQVAGLTAALQFYAEDDNGCAFADYDAGVKSFGMRARAALAAVPAPTPARETE